MPETKEITLNHDSTVRTDWLPMGLTRKQAQEFQAELESLLSLRGWFDYHSWAHNDFVAVTAPASWKDTYGRSHTVKARGCSGFRNDARRVAPGLADQMGLRYGSLETVTANKHAEMPLHEIDTLLIEARDNDKVALIYCGTSFNYVRGVPKQAKRNGEGILVIPVGQREIALATISKVEVEA